MNAAPMTTAARIAAALCLAATGAHAQDTRDPAISRYGVERIDLRRPDIPAAGVTTTVGGPESRTTLVARTDNALSAILPRGALNSTPGQLVAGVQFVIGPMPDWLARQHGLDQPEAFEPDPPTLLDRSLDARLFADRVRVATAIDTQRFGEDPRHRSGDRAMPGAFAIGRDLSVSALLRQALIAEREAATKR